MPGTREIPFYLCLGTITRKQRSIAGFGRGSKGNALSDVFDRAIGKGRRGSPRPGRQLGHDTYMVASHGTMGYSSAGAQKAKAYEYANDFCKAKDREVQTVSDRETDNCRSCLHTSRLSLTKLRAHFGDNFSGVNYFPIL